MDKLVRVRGRGNPEFKQDLLPRLFYVTTPTHHGHANQPPYRSLDQIRLRRERDDHLGVCEANPSGTHHGLQRLRTPHRGCVAVGKNFFGAETQFLIRC